MATAKKSKIPPEKLALYEKLIATNPNIERKGAVHTLYFPEWPHVYVSGSDWHCGHPSACR
jgi:hypothetical protein